MPAPSFVLAAVAVGLASIAEPLSCVLLRGLRSPRAEQPCFTHGVGSRRLAGDGGGEWRQELAAKEEAGLFDHVIVNDDLDAAYDKLKALVLPELQRTGAGL